MIVLMFLMKLKIESCKELIKKIQCFKDLKMLELKINY
jgi:hypothetical protein